MGLQNSDVRTIFECLHNNKTPPPNLQFQIIAVGPNGKDLSPPSYEFEDGLYVLLKPQRKKDKVPDYSKVPSHLQGYIMKHQMQETCPWGLSGPQYKHPTAIQQRYCYPKGNVEYAKTKGGALWTMYLANGQEDREFRLLHVYYSDKRAKNKGTPNAGAVSDDSYSPPSKRPKLSRGGMGKSRAQHRTPRATRSRVHRRLPTASPATTTAGSCHSPATSVDTLPPPSIQFSPPTHLNIETNIPMPPLNHHNLIMFDSVDCDDAFDERRIHPVASYDMASPYGDIFAGGPPPLGNFSGILPYRRAGPAMPPLMQEIDTKTPKKRSSQTLYPHQQLNQSMLMHKSDKELHTIFFDDPLLSIPTQPSMDYFDSVTERDTMENFASHLENIHKRIQDMIKRAPSGDQAAMVSTLTSWAQNVATLDAGSTTVKVEVGKATTPAKKEGASSK